MLSAAQCYQAFVSHDVRFDGRFFVGVRSTRIYCRPICRVKRARRKNCTFYGWAAAAEAAGYRPCKVCRPELAPAAGSSSVANPLARSTAAYIARDFLANHSLAELAVELNVTDRQIRRVFREEFGVSPIEYWQTQRLLLARQLLTDTQMPVVSVALASGFQSLRRFNFALKDRYRMTPTELRQRSTRKSARDHAGFAFRLGYRPPFDWDGLLTFLSRRAIAGVELVRDASYSRTVGLVRDGVRHAGQVTVRHEPKDRMVVVEISDSLVPVCAVILERVRRLFDLDADPEMITAALGPLAATNPGLRVPGSFDGFELAVRAVLGHLVSVSGARTTAARFNAHFGTKIKTDRPELSLLFPTSECVAQATVPEIARLGITSQKAGTIRALAGECAAGRLRLEPGNRIEGTLRDLRRIPGIGEWTAQYIAMRALAWPDAFPHTDLGVRKALAGLKPTQVLAEAEKWRPWRAYATFHLWRSLRNGSPRHDKINR